MKTRSRGTKRGGDRALTGSRFLNELADAKTLYIRIRSLGFGRTTADFNVEGGAAAMAATTGRCPPAIQEPKPKRKPRR